MSERKAQAIYNAVSEAVLRWRINMAKQDFHSDLDGSISDIQHKAAQAAVEAYRKPLKQKARKR